MKGMTMVISALAAMGADTGGLMPRGKGRRVVGYYDPEKDKVDAGRNDLCPCRSGKKFKNCCTKRY